ncbi:poly(A) RNA polymerase GLD2-like isoform X3 [Argiope bruennichi]|uniref:poly(A) RNA polymerase GLD2-like isoform X3 n=1 Tax=Argiope bruennichi TaxID=94029 RepID=UPI00249499C3|nr:poly(A) RNA polymerase GLD2-like isoform X3 [Argiope bruennichi]
MDGYTPVSKKPPAVNTPVFCTGLANMTVDVDALIALLCKSCKKNVKNFDPDAKNLCNDCLSQSKQNESSKQVKKSDISSTPTCSSVNTSNAKTLLPSPVNPGYSDSHANISKEFLVPANDTPEQHLNNSNSPKDFKTGEMKWKSDLRGRLNPRSKPYQRFTRNNESTSKQEFQTPHGPHFLQSPVTENENFTSGRDFRRNRNSSFTSPPLLNRSSPGNSTVTLSREIWGLFHKNKQSDDIFNCKMELRDKLHQILRQQFPNCGLYVVGSSMTGLGVSSSDIDMCLMLTDEEVDQQKEAIGILHTIKRLFHKYKFLYDIQIIYAKVPILRFVDGESGIEVDLNINNAIGIRNTQLLTSYARIDGRLPPLVVLVKLWARCHDINDAKNNSLSSYSIVLMVIHYLQYRCRPPVLPCLQQIQPDKYLPRSDIRKLKLHEELPNFISENQEDLGDLFIGFLKYYSEEFNYRESAMSIRLGGVISREDAAQTTSPKNKHGHWKYICIEEPFDQTNTARAVFNQAVFDRIQHVFKTSWNRITKICNLSSVLS